jgi:hypothetical protein
LLARFCHPIAYSSDIGPRPLDQPVDEWTEFQQAADEEGCWIVEAQHPEEISSDLRVEAHILADAWSIAFRRRWAELGYTDH